MACLAPRPDASPVIRRMPAHQTQRRESPVLICSGAVDQQAAVPSSGQEAWVPSRATVVPPAVGPAAPRAVVAAVSPARYRIQCTIGEEGHANLRLAQDLLRREVPSGDPGVIVERALALLVSQIAKEKTAATTAPRPPRSGTPGSPYIPAAVKRAVWVRDRGQCAFVARSGRRWGGGDRGQHLAALPAAQRVRGGTGIWSERTRSGRHSTGAGTCEGAGTDASRCTQLIGSPNQGTKLASPRG